MTLSIDLLHFFNGLVALLIMMGICGLLVWIDERHRRIHEEKTVALNSGEDQEGAETEEEYIEKTHENEYDLEAWTHIRVGKHQTQ